MEHLLLWIANSNAEPRERKKRKGNGKWGSFSVPVDNAPRDGEKERGSILSRLDQRRAAFRWSADLLGRNGLHYIPFA